MSEIAVELKDVKVVNGMFKMENVNLTIKKGFITAITGANGSGKTTLIETIAGVNAVIGGSIKINGCDLYMEPVKAKNMMGFIFHECPFNEILTAKNIMDRYGCFYEHFDKNVYKELCSEFELDMKSRIKNMSKGQAVKLQLAFALAHDSKIMLFDDATEGLDPVFRRALKKRLMDIVSDGEHTVIMATKIPEDLENIVDYVVALSNGTVTSVSDIEQINEQYKGGIREYLKEGGRH